MRQPPSYRCADPSRRPEPRQLAGPRGPGHIRRMTGINPRLACALAALAAGFALGTAFAFEWWGGLVPCALCLVERWPYRVAIGLGVVGVLLPGWLPRLALVGVLLAGLASVGAAGLHVGVEFGWWPSPLPECAAPHFQQRLDRRPAALDARRPSKAVRGHGFPDSGDPDFVRPDGLDLRGCCSRPASRVLAGQDRTERKMSETAAGRLPGDPTARQLVERMIRVDHAGEYGAKRIYQGQLAVLGRGADGKSAAPHAGAGAGASRRIFRTDREAARPPDGAAAAVAFVRFRARRRDRGDGAEGGDGLHRRGGGSDRRTLFPPDRSARRRRSGLRDTIEAFRAEELQHRDIGLEHGAEQAPGYRMLSRAIKAGCRIAIKISERV